MNKLVTTLALLLTVISSAFTYASVDSASLSSFCKIVSVDDPQKFRVLYNTPQVEDVKVLLYDDKNRLVFSEVVKGTDSFVREYDLSTLDEGEYLFELKSADFLHQEFITNSSWKADDLLISQVGEDKVAFVGKGGQSFQLNILDDQGNVVLNDSFEKGQQIDKLYNLEDLEGSQASFVIFNGQSVAREEIVKL